ncbi:MAG: Nucleotidyl transferase [uncultured bacterium]|nr:MAG: Nucleotidyl transferase [uncultured bacterium]
MDRERLTITLSQDVVKQIDNAIDGVKLRNRSHTIEYYLTKALGPKINKIMILAGGQGLKMRPFTYEMPKCMIPLHGKPLLEHIIEKIRDQGVRDIILAIDYLGNKVRDYFGDGSKFGIKIKYIEQDKPTGTAPPLAKAKSFLGNEPFILMHGDVLANIDLSDLFDFHQSHKGLITIALTSVADPSAYGAVKLQGNKIVDFQEKIGGGPEVSRLINAGIYVVDPKLINYIPQKTVSSLEKDVLPALVKKGHVRGYVFDGLWFDISTPDVYERALKEWNIK